MTADISSGTVAEGVSAAGMSDDGLQAWEALCGLPAGFLSAHPDRIQYPLWQILDRCTWVRESRRPFGHKRILDEAWALAKGINQELMYEMLEEQLLNQPVWQWVNEGEAEAVRRWG